MAFAVAAAGCGDGDCCCDDEDDDDCDGSGGDVDVVLVVWIGTHACVDAATLAHSLTWSQSQTRQTKHHHHHVRFLQRARGPLRQDHLPMRIEMPCECWQDPRRKVVEVDAHVATAWLVAGVAAPRDHHAQREALCQGASMWMLPS